MPASISPTWGSPTPSTSRASWCTPRIPISCTWLPRDTNTPSARTAASTRPPTAARAGRKSSIRTRRPASSTWPWTRRIPRFCMPAPPSGCVIAGTIPIQSVESGLYKTVDGGRTWTALTNGLPDFSKGDSERVGIDVCRPSPMSSMRSSDRSRKRPRRRLPLSQRRQGRQLEAGRGQRKNQEHLSPDTAGFSARSGSIPTRTSSMSWD